MMTAWPTLRADQIAPSLPLSTLSKPYLVGLPFLFTISRNGRAFVSHRGLRIARVPSGVIVAISDRARTNALTTMLALHTHTSSSHVFARSPRLAALRLSLPGCWIQSKMSHRFIAKANQQVRWLFQFAGVP
jgi:hypothetical protein